ncbi:HAD family hydrolase [Mariniphaga sediminis]|uniref:HAD family hydrolase n=1 Tax=Mariniphaga sediminis TaxID=1628158 RepID=A0A399DA34_9BACT|nr:HAD family hydrolase [Mariniphaga sediminis]RIH67092.1 HAD family hydrolase [Mariniphaga sediminis]
MIIFFDLDDTLLDSETAHKKAIQRIISKHSLNININHAITEWLYISDKYLKLFFHKKITNSQQRISRIKELWTIAGQQITDKEALLNYQEYHQYFLQMCFPFPETISFFEKNKKNKFGIITNGPIADQTNKLKKSGLIHYFKPIIISEEVGYSKPQKKNFDIAAERSDEQINDCIHIGDSYELDYCGATNAGMKAICIDRKKSGKLLDCNLIHSLNELDTRFQI